MIETIRQGMDDGRGFIRRPLLTRCPLNGGMHLQEKHFRIARLFGNEAGLDLNANALACAFPQTS